MSNALVSHNPDIGRLIERGMRSASTTCPTSSSATSTIWIASAGFTGAIVSKFVDVGQDRIVQENHQIFFAGSIPHDENGKAIPNLGGGPTTLALSEKSKDVVVKRSFSNKPVPSGKFEDFFEKIDSYVTIISRPSHLIAWCKSVHV